MKKFVVPVSLGFVFGVCVMLALIGTMAYFGEASIQPSPTLTTAPHPTKTRTAVQTRTPIPTRTPRPSPTPEYGTKRNPVGLGEYVTLVQNNVIEFMVAVVDVTRGEDAWDIVLNSNQFNDPPSSGMEYMAATIDVIHTGSDDEILEVYDSLWSSLSNKRVFDFSSPCCFDGVSLSSGGQANMVVVVPVYIDDDSPLLIFGGFSGDKIYFSVSR